MNEFFDIISSNGIVFGFIIGFFAWAIGKAISIGFSFFDI